MPGFIAGSAGWTAILTRTLSRSRFPLLRSLALLPRLELTQCCACKITADGLLSESVKLNLTANPLRGIVNSRGIIKVISSATESDVSTAFGANTPAPVASPYFVTETEAAHSNLSAGEQTLLQNLCMYDALLSGKPCTC